MTLHEAWWTWLKSRPGVAAALGDRVFPHVLPDRATLPAATYTRTSTDRERNLSGTSGLCRAVIEFMVAGTTLEQAEAAADAVRQAVDGFQGDLGGVWVWEIAVEGQGAGYDESLDRHFVGMDIVIEHAETPST